ncbi:MAG: TetR/AcrR family transcriptional regulator [Lachnospiraceae bacterium]|jgi:AcrR family transcriptional regulator|nr:TetR/AcrR family transcriptional regulator [Lachnospiraceae bacterium]
MSKRRKEVATKGERTRESILNAAYALFAKKGFKQVTMKDVCEVTNMSRGGLYSHFSSTSQLFEALLERITEKDALDFQEQMKQGASAIAILEEALKLMEEEMKHPEDSLSIAMYEYAETVDSEVMERLNKASKKKWKQLIRYGIERGEFQNIDASEVVNVILYSYQGVRMWSRILPMKPKTMHSIVENIKRQLIGERK